MRGSIKSYKGPRGKSWKITFDIGRDPISGKRKQKRITFEGSRKEAENKLSELISEVERGIYADPGKLSLKDFLLYWIDGHRENLAPSTSIRYAGIITDHIIPSLGNIQLKKLTPMHIQSFYKEKLRSGRIKKGGLKKGLAPASVIYIHRVLHKALHQAVKWQLLYRNPCDYVDPPKKDRKEMNILDDIGIALLLNEVKGSYLYLPVFLALFTGMRLGEILGLRWQDINFKFGIIMVRQTIFQRTVDDFIFRTPKTPGSVRRIEISQVVIEVLQKHKEQQEARAKKSKSPYDYDLVCCYETGWPINPQTVSSRFRIIMNKLGYQVRFHDLRHTHATILLQEGENPKVVAERLGHSSIRLTLETYSHVIPGMQREAANKIERRLFDKIEI